MRLLSAVLPAWPAEARPCNRGRLVTTDGEFHTIRRQLDRLAEEGVDVVKVAARPADTLAERLARRRRRSHGVRAGVVGAVRDGGDRSGPRHAGARVRASRRGAAGRRLPPSERRARSTSRRWGVERAFVIGGGYKYCQLGEGNCFLRVPPGCELRPVITGWFSEFGELARRSGRGEVRYGARRGALRRRDLRSDVALPRGRGLRLSSARWS